MLRQRRKRDLERELQKFSAEVMMGKRLWIGTAVLASLLTGCTVHAGVYDPYRHDYHHWDAHERGEYQQWARDNHRDADYKKLSSSDQQQYWEWRHQQDGH